MAQHAPPSQGNDQQAAQTLTTHLQVSFYAFRSAMQSHEYDNAVPALTAIQNTVDELWPIVSRLADVDPPPQHPHQPPQQGGGDTAFGFFLGFLVGAGLVYYGGPQ